MRRLCLAPLAACGAVLLSASPAVAASFPVDSVADVPAVAPVDDGVCDSAAGPALTCTLRAAVQEANALAGADTIQLPNLGLAYALDEAGAGEDSGLSGDLDLRTQITLQGSGQPVINAMGIDRVLQIGPAATAPSVSVSGVELRGGAGVSTGGGVLVDSGSLALNEVTITANTAAGAIARGGGIWFQSGTSHAITASTLNGNQASGVEASGGGIGATAGVGLSLTNSTVTANTATAVAGPGRGGGIWSSGGISLTHVTMSEDTATGSPAQGGLVYADAGSLAFRATILDQGTAGPGAENCETGTGLLSSSGSNLEALRTGAGVQCNLSGAALDRFAFESGVTPLGIRGGPTQTHALFNGSPALDAIPSCDPITSDQRGLPRPGAFACDIGSFERQVQASPGESCFGRRPTILGFSKSETIIGTPRDDVIIADAGNDLIKAREGNDRICGGKGKDRIFGATGDDRVEGDEDDDRLYGQGGSDLLRGDSGGDRLDGGKGLDRLDGGAGRDNCRGGGRDKRRAC